MLNRWICSAMASAALLVGTGAHAARDFTPQAGTWMVSSELDGKPGRGLAIDVQGNTFFMQVFGYEKNGEATFYTATGTMDGDSVTAPLMRYTGGRSFGGSARDAVEDQSLGNVTMSFSNGLKGTVQFPGEPAVAIERFLVKSDVPSVTNPLAQLGGREMRFWVQDGRGEVVYHWRADLSLTEGNVLQLALTLRKAESGMANTAWVQNLACSVDDGSTRLVCTPIVSPGLPSGPALDLPQVEGITLQIAGYDVAGTVALGGLKPAMLSFTGVDTGARLYEPSYREGRMTWTPVAQQNYWAANYSSGGMCQVTCYGQTYTNTLMPLNGTWIVEDELTGKPGRGVALDIQGSMAIAQIFNYRANGQPTFHMGSAAYLSKGVGSGSTVASIPLAEFAGGRSVGGQPQSAQLYTEAGAAALEFRATPDPKAPTGISQTWWTTGQLQLPGEESVRIRRLVLDAPTSFAERMLGDWYLSYTDKVVRFERADGDTVTSTDGKVVCTNVTWKPGTNVGCGEPNGNLWTWHQFAYLPDMGRSSFLIRLRDRFGNAVGLGKLD